VGVSHRPRIVNADAHRRRIARRAFTRHCHRTAAKPPAAQTAKNTEHHFHGCKFDGHGEITPPGLKGLIDKSCPGIASINDRHTGWNRIDSQKQGKRDWHKDR
jgi:hypothetical protein